MTEPKRNFRDSAIQAVALIGLILVLMLGAWGIILLAFNLPTIATNVGGSIVSLFGSAASTTPSSQTSTTTVVIAQPSKPSTPISYIPTAQPTEPTPSTPVQTYVPATHTTNLYGYADLAVRIISVTPTTPAYGGVSRVNVQFEVSNVGTNLAAAGWTLSANLPVGYTYIYNSPAQPALYPGDKIVYTMGFNTAYQNQYCTQQYPNQNCPWYSQPYQTYPYQGTCYRYDGYQNLPVPCTDSNGSPIYVNQNYNSSYNQGYNYGYSYTGNLVTITVDPRNWIYDLNRANNIASIASPLY